MASKKAPTKKRDSNKNRVGRSKKAVKEAAVEIKNAVKEELSPNEKKFCEIYVSPTEFYGNGTQSYIEAYNVLIIKGTNKKNVPKGKKGMTYESVRDAAYKLLTRTDILTELNENLEAQGLNDAFVDKQLKHLITQHADPRVKISAIAEYNKLMSRIVAREAHMHTFANEDMSDEELMERIKKKRAFFNKE